MFEKEADKYVKVFTDRSHIWSNDKLMQLQLREAYKDGAEFGWNKANEWHKVADRDLPSEEGSWVCNQDGLPCYYDWSTEQWLDCEGTQIRTTEWCNMPHKESK